eukprot:8514930-Ditylum_brightwellii.AAC.1
MHPQDNGNIKVNLVTEAMTTLVLRITGYNRISVTNSVNITGHYNILTMWISAFRYQKVLAVALTSLMLQMMKKGEKYQK